MVTTFCRRFSFSISNPSIIQSFLATLWTHRITTIGVRRSVWSFIYNSRNFNYCFLVYWYIFLLRAKHLKVAQFNLISFLVGHPNLRNTSGTIKFFTGLRKRRYITRFKSVKLPHGYHSLFRDYFFQFLLANLRMFKLQTCIRWYSKTAVWTIFVISYCLTVLTTAFIFFGLEYELEV